MKQFSIDIVQFVCYNHNDMKYTNYFSPKKSIILLLAALLCLSLFACNDEEDSESSELSEASEYTSSVAEESEALREFSVEKAVELLQKDRKVIEMFVCGTLCQNKAVAVPQKVSADSGFAQFSAVESLLAQTYSQSGGSIDAFLSYPEVGENAITNENGETYAFYHAGSGYDDFADTSSVTLKPSENADVCDFTVKTAAGRVAEMKAVRSENGWVLENSLYDVLSDNSGKFKKNFPLANKGSLSKFSGNVLVIELFISDNSSGFTSEEESEFHSRISSAVSYLTDEAQRYGGQTRVKYERAYFDHTGVLSDHELAFDIMFAETGFGTLQTFAEKNFDLSKYDNYVFAVCFDKNWATSHWVYDPDSDKYESPELYFAERVFVGKETTDAEICRALLSMLGVENVCAENSSEYIRELYRLYFPADVLLSENIGGTKISPVVAYACGITEDLERLYRVFFN